MVLQRHYSNPQIGKFTIHIRCVVQTQALGHTQK